MKYSLKEIKNNIDELNVPLSSRLFSHPISIILVYILANFTSVGPNLLTGFSFLFRISIIYALLTENMVLVAVFAYIAHLLDSSDGILARTVNKTSRFGAALDPLMDKIGYSLIAVALIVYLYAKGLVIESFIMLVFLAMFFIENSFLEVCSLFREKEIFRKSSKLESRKSQFDFIFRIPIFGFLLKKYITLTSKLKVNPIPSLIESYFIIFIIAPLFYFDTGIIIAGILAYIPQFLFSFFRALLTLRSLK